MIAGLVRAVRAGASAGGATSFAGVGRPGRRLAMVFQEPTLMPWATVAKNVRTMLELDGVARGAADDRVAAMLELVGLRDFANAYPRELSGGMKMRASLARALVTEPTCC